VDQVDQLARTIEIVIGWSWWWIVSLAVVRFLIALLWWCYFHTRH